MRHILLFVAGLASAAGVQAQTTHVLPNGMANAAGGTANAFPWGTSAGSWPGLRILACYDSSNFTAASINFPILITRLRWRANDSTSTWTGGVYSQASISMSTAAVDYTAVSQNWPSNHGPDLTVVHNGPVVVQAGTGNGTGVPAPFHVDVPLATPFPYDPSQGDLVIDTDWVSGAFAGGSLTSMDIDNANAAASRVYGSSVYPNANGTTQNHGIVVEVTYIPAGPGTALSTPYGDGCYSRFASFYETFAPGTFDLSNTSMQLIPTGGGYVALPTTSSFHTPTTPPLVLGNDTVSAAQPLGFTLSYPGGTTSAVFVSSNGFVWAQSNTQAGCCSGSGPALVADGARWCPLWTNLNPANGGSVHFDVDAQNGVAYVTFVGVFENATTNPNTFQVALFSTGIVEYRYQQCTVTASIALAGWSPGGGARDPGSIDLGATLPVVTEIDEYPLRLTAGARPVVNTSVPVTARDVPQSSPLGAVVGGLTQMLPGLDLSAFGMPGCVQLCSQDAVVVFVPANGSATISLGVPNDPGLSGTSLFLQAATLVPGINTLGATSSNGLELLIGIQ